MNLSQPVPALIILHLLCKGTFGDLWNRVLCNGCPSCHPTISIKALKATWSTTLTSGLATPFLHSEPVSWWRNTAPFMLLQCQYHCTRLTCKKRYNWQLKQTCGSNEKGYFEFKLIRVLKLRFKTDLQKYVTCDHNNINPNASNQSNKTVKWQTFGHWSHNE